MSISSPDAEEVHQSVVTVHNRTTLSKLFSNLYDGKKIDIFTNRKQANDSIMRVVELG